MIMLNILITCRVCAGRPERDSQPNYCPKCGGRGELKRKITEHQLRRLPETPKILSAYVQKKEAPR